MMLFSMAMTVPGTTLQKMDLANEGAARAIGLLGDNDLISIIPVDSAAGEGFTNVGNALVMSPALVQKYLDAGKDIASRAMLLPHGIEFSPKTTSRPHADVQARYRSTLASATT